MNIIKLDSYVVGGLISGEISRELRFLDFDYASGGYPSTANYIRNTYNSPLDAWKDLPKAASDYVRMKDPKVYRIVLEEVDMSSYDNDQKKVESVLDNLTKEQKQLLKKML